MLIQRSEEAVAISAPFFSIPRGQELESRRVNVMLFDFDSQKLRNTVHKTVLVPIDPKKGISGKSGSPAQSFESSVPIDIKGDRISRVTEIETIDLEIDDEDASLSLDTQARVNC